MMHYQVLNRAILKITGDDAAKFLQGIITNDIYSQGAIYAMMLGANGRYLFDFFITNLDGGYFLEADIVNLEELISKLKLYIIRSKVKIEDVTSKYQIVYSKTSLEGAYILRSYQDPRFRRMGFRAIVSGQSLVSTSNIYFEDKYLYAIPDGNIDLIHNKSMPQEYGADHLNAINYSKGCYLGQEVICRTKTQGVVRKNIFKITANQDLSHIPQGTPLLAADHKIGLLCSAYHNFAISLLRIEDYELYKQMHLTLSGIAITLEVPEWMVISRL